MSNNVLAWPTSFRENTINIVMVGAGGNGSECFDGLVKLHHALKCLGHEGGLSVTVYDDDTVTEAVVIRQKYWPHEIGQNKAETLVHKANVLFGTQWKAIAKRFTAEKNQLNGVDVLITCVDNLKSRKQTYEASKGMNTDAIWLDMGNTKSAGQVVIGHLGKPSSDVARVKNVADLYEEILTNEDIETGDSCSAIESIQRQDLFINSKVATSGMNLLWQLIRHGSTSTNAVLIDLSDSSEFAIAI